MKKFLVGIIILGLIIAGYFIFTQNNSKTEKLTKVKVGEVTHSIFYAPQYVALGLDYFKNEGLDVNFVLTPGEDKKK